MKIIMQCAGSKWPAGFFRSAEGGKVFFVARPEKAPQDTRYIYTRPDDPSDFEGKTWRQKVSEYNKDEYYNPFHLYPAYKLYRDKIYGRLVDTFGIANVFILSAGWGLLRSDFLTPTYDITFSQTKDGYKKRRDTDVYQDYCQLPKEVDEKLIFFGGVTYVSLLARLTSCYKGKKFAFSASQYGHAELESAGFKVTQRRKFTKWQYQCANDFIDGKISL